MDQFRSDTRAPEIESEIKWINSGHSKSKINESSKPYSSEFFADERLTTLSEVYFLSWDCCCTRGCIYMSLPIRDLCPRTSVERSRAFYPKFAAPRFLRIYRRDESPRRPVTPDRKVRSKNHGEDGMGVGTWAGVERVHGLLRSFRSAL